HTPEERKPERPDLPTKVRLEVAPSRLTSLYIIDDDGNDRRHAKHEGTDNSRGGRDADQQAQGVQRIDTMGNGNKARWRGSDGRCGVVGHERCASAKSPECVLYTRLRQKNRPRAYLDDGNFKAPNGSSSRILGLLGGMANLARISSRGSLACWKKSTSRSRSLLQPAPRATASAIRSTPPGADRLWPSCWLTTRLAGMRPDSKRARTPTSPSIAPGVRVAEV